MRRISGLLVIGAFLLTGCAAAPAEPKPTQTAAAEPTYLDLMRDTKAFFGADDAALNKIGHSICDALEDGSTYDDAAEMLGVAGLTASQAESVIFASADEFCPSQAR